ncbi:hypothetical protein CALK_2400 [Chitinivibrio alkaliphilus ACht1]|uniref:Uncharacterized protein n=1 Tax=Chitinivibrio alkaliphilus ACht1 TaxID=1313304 RepID=U7D469_9BACT|nr:hypothetical protein CALK_2400 [Chitinivibrio alkaliphilus ACht1]
MIQPAREELPHTAHNFATAGEPPDPVFPEKVHSSDSIENNRARHPQ